MTVQAGGASRAAGTRPARAGGPSGAPHHSGGAERAISTSGSSAGSRRRRRPHSPALRPARPDDRYAVVALRRVLWLGAVTSVGETLRLSALRDVLELVRCGAVVPADPRTSLDVELAQRLRAAIPQRRQ